MTTEEKIRKFGSGCRFDRWGVDVREDGQLIRRGIIRDWVPHRGLVLDFLHPDHHADFIPFKHFVHVATNRNPKVGEEVDALVQRCSDETFRWYPAKLLATDGFPWGYAYVEMYYDGGPQKEVVRGYQARLRIGAPSVQVVSGANAVYRLYRRTLRLPTKPELLAITQKAGFLDHWDNFMEATGSQLVGGCLVYLSYEWKKCTRWNFEKMLGYMEKDAKFPSRGTKRTVDGDEVGEISRNIHEDSDRLVDLPLVIIEEIFSLAKLDDKVRCSKVCREWHLILSTVGMARQVHLDLPDLCSLYNSTKLCTATALHKKVGPAIKQLFLYGHGSSAYYAARAVVPVLQAKAVQIPVLVLSAPMDWAQNVAEMGWALQGVCAKFYWRNPRFTYELDMQVFNTGRLVAERCE